MKKIITTTLIFFCAIIALGQQQKQDTSNYHLIGKLDDFKILFAAITTPDDVTANQKKAIAEWLKSIKIIIPNVKPDSTAKQKNPIK